MTLPGEINAAAAIDWSRLLAPVSASNPSGPNLEYAPEFAELEQAARGTPDRQMGTALLPGHPPDTALVLARALALLERTKDLRVVVQLLPAVLANAGLAPFLAGLAALRGMLERFWDSLHPGLDPDDDAQATARANAIVALASPELVLSLRRTTLIAAPGFGGVNLEQAQAGREPTAAGLASAECVRLNAAIRTLPSGALPTLATSLELALEDTRAIGATFATHAAPPPQLDALSRYFNDALAVLHAQLRPAPNDVASAGLEPARSDSEPEGALESEQRSPAIGNRADVIRSLEQICEYYREREPSSPLPLLLRRCQRLANLDFLEILQELAPEALPKINLTNATDQRPAHAR